MFRRLSLFAVALLIAAPSAVKANGSNASTDVDNTVAPTSVVNQQTGGGVNLNQQYNNQWDNHNGFAPGVFCRTPTAYVGGGYNQANVWGSSFLGSSTNNSGIHAGVLMPFGSSVIEDCKRMAKALSDRAEFSNQASLAKTCHELEGLGIKIDPKRFPKLKACVAEEQVETELN